jgi:hypothetical protein
MEAITLLTVAHQHPGQLRETPEYKLWKMALMDRDNSTCQLCGSTKDLHAHHRTPISVDPSKAFDIENGIIVCSVCHHNIHRKKGYIKRSSTPNSRSKKLKEYKDHVCKLNIEVNTLRESLTKLRDINERNRSTIDFYKDEYYKLKDTPQISSIRPPSTPTIDHKQERYKKQIEDKDKLVQRVEEDNKSMEILVNQLQIRLEYRDQRINYLEQFNQDLKVDCALFLRTQGALIDKLGNPRLEGGSYQALCDQYLKELLHFRDTYHAQPLPILPKERKPGLFKRLFNIH